jgi:tripartite-type tricarboxylate transporter receptor subunit TctC
MIVPYGPGGETDVFARAISGKLGSVLGQTIVVDNRAGATGIVGTEMVASSKPDGYTLIFGTAATHALNLSAFKSLPYHPLRSFEPIAFVGSVPLVLFAHPSMPSTPTDFVALLKKNPEKYSYGSAGMSTSYLGIELFKHAAGVSALQVPYKGSGAALQDLVGGQVQFMGASIGVGAPMMQAGKVKAIGVMSKDRLPAAPDVPTFEENGILGLDVGTWNVIMAPANTPRSIVEHLNSAINQVLKDPGIRERLSALGIFPNDNSTPASTADRIAQEIDKWAEAFKMAGATAQ